MEQIRCSLKTCFLICASIQLLFMMTFGPSLFNKGVHNHYINDNPEADHTTVYALLVNSITGPHSTTRPPRRHPTIPVFEGGVKKDATLFIQWYEKTCNEERRNASDGQQLCPCVPPELKGRLLVETCVPSWDAIAQANRVVRPGGEWSPADCINTEKLAIVVPYRDRDEHLRIFLNHMHPVLRRQRISYRIFVVEQAFPEVFNKASMMNIGFIEAMTFGSYDCVIFHDVDMMLEDDRHMYRCSYNIRHMGANVNKFGYRLAYNGLFGGATAFRKKHFEQVNGFTNKFFGWGGEDDDMWQRIRAQNLTVVRFPPPVSRYTMIKHSRDSTNQVNPYSYLAWRSRKEEYQRDGLRSLKYRIHETKFKPLYTWIYAEPVTALEHFNSYWGRIDEETYLTKTLCLVDCAAACAAQPACKAFTTHNFMCKLKSTAFLRLRCKRFQCDLVYIKKTYSKQVQLASVLQKFVEVSGSCSDIRRESISQPLDFEQCASACDRSIKCLAFVHKTRPEACIMSPCDVLEPTNTSNIFFRIPPNIMTHFTRRGGDCKGGDIEGVLLSLQQCATRCRLTVECAGFAFVKDSSCWLKKQTCEITEKTSGIFVYDRL